MHLFGSFVFLSVFLLLEIHGSAIPMWEYLSRDEKMSYLYSMFANQVEEFCEFSEMNNCNNELLNYGLKKLKVMPNDHLDNMDPYQRGAHTIIWGSMMDGHEMMRTSTTPKPRSRSTTVKPNSYDDDQGYQGDDFDTAASQSTGNVYKVVAPQNLIRSDPPKVRTGVHYIHPNYATIRASLPQYRLPPPQRYPALNSPINTLTNQQQSYINNNQRRFQPVYIPLATNTYNNNNNDNDNNQNGASYDSYRQDGGGNSYRQYGGGNSYYDRRRQDTGSYSSKIAEQYQPLEGVPKFAEASDRRAAADDRDVRDVPLTGPMVVRVHLDGTPVQDGGVQQLPHDEDLRQYKMSKAKLPTF